MKAIGPLVGFVMRETKGRADGGEVTRLIREKLGLVTACNSCTSCHTGHGLERRHRRRRLRRRVRGARARAAAAEAVGAADPRQRRQLPALHAVPAGGGGGHARAAPRGHAAARHPASAPTCASARSAATTPRRARSTPATHEGEDEELRYDQLLVAVGSVSRSLPVPGLDQHAIGFKSLADAIWLRNHVIETLEQANATEDPARREELLTYVFVGGGYSGLEALAELQDFAADAMDALPARPPARDALDPGRGDGPGAARGRPPELADYALRELRGRGIDIRLGTRLEEARADSVQLSTGEQIPTRTIVWTAGRRAAPEPRLARRCRSTRAAGSEVDESHAGRGPRAASGRSATAPRSPTRTTTAPAPCPPTAQHAVRQGPGRSPTTSPPSSASATRRARSATGPRRRSSTSAATRPSASSAAGAFRGFLAWWMARTYHMSQIPGARAQDPRGRRLDRRPAVRARRRRGRLDRPPAPASRRGLRARRHPPPARS